MQGLALARAYYEAYGKALLEENLAPYRTEVAVGLVGEGSECFGYDDRWSQDHDFGPGFCIWVPEGLYREAGAVMQAAYEALPQQFMGYRRSASAYGNGRVGVMSLEGFYERLTGLPYPPEDALEWLRIPEEFLATATNGAVFYDGAGTFSTWRALLQDFYPDDVMRKKLAAKCATMAKTGQYNYGRSLLRGDRMATYLACSEFVKAAFGALYLINGEYMPYYKWVLRGTERFTVLQDTVASLERLVTLADDVTGGEEKKALIEGICADVARYLYEWGYTRTKHPFLQHQAESLMAGIGDARLRAMNILVDG